MVLEKTLKSPLDCKEIKLVNCKGNQPWIFIGRTDAEAEALILWPLDAKTWLIGKDPEAGKDWGQEEKGTTEDEMVGWHHWLDEHQCEQSLGQSDGQGGLVCCSPWCCKESDMTGCWNELILSVLFLWQALTKYTLLCQRPNRKPVVITLLSFNLIKVDYASAPYRLKRLSISRSHIVMCIFYILQSQTTNSAPLNPYILCFYS